MHTPRFGVATILLVAAVGLGSACSSSSTNPAAGGTGGQDAGKPCSTDDQCDDSDACNGVESCQGGFCVSGVAAADGTACTPPGLGGGAGDAKYVCDKAACRLTCAEDSDCDDGDRCTGTETCGPSKTCQTGTPLDCDDGDTCTKDECNPESGCLHPLIDQDGDGYASSELGACGNDCNDANADIHPDAADPCGDAVDGDCDGHTDDAAPTWYADCDGDGFAPASAQQQTSCSLPANPPAACPGGKWIGKPPDKGTTDCADQSADAYPRTAAEDASAWRSTPIPGATTAVDFDYNCDGTEEKHWTQTGAPQTGECHLAGGFGPCTGPSGWTGSTVPDCGASADYSRCVLVTSSGCVRKVEKKTQECR